MAARRAPVDFATFFALWAEEQGWDVPDVHWRAVHWLQHRGALAVLLCFRGFGKSTLLAVYNAWRYYADPSYRILHQGDQDRTAYKTSRDTRSVLQRHPLTRAQPALALRGEQSFWWVAASADERNPSMQAAGITSNITSSRCDEAQNDDVEVPRNIQNPEAREKMRYRLGEQTHCMVPGARQLFVGTPHTHDSLYDEMTRAGADRLAIPMFAREKRFESVGAGVLEVGFVPELVFSGIGAEARLLTRGKDYLLRGSSLTLSAPAALLDCYAGSAWPERFGSKEMLSRRRKCKTVNEWDSQYQLHSRPLHEMRLDPARLRRYSAEPVVRVANGELGMWRGDARIVAAAARWDPSSGKVTSDASSLSVMLQDEIGRRYWHRVLEMRGEVAQTSEDGKTIIGGQVTEIVRVVRELHLPRVSVETNGIGGFAPAFLKAAFKQARLVCGVSEVQSTANKNRRILEAFEGPLKSGQLWAHDSVLDGPTWNQMRDWNPVVPSQPDDHLDSGAGALVETPERITRAVERAGSAGLNAPAVPSENWRPSAGMHEVELEF